MTANVDAQEIAKFEHLASRWWDPDSEFKPLHDLNPVRLSYLEARVGDLTGLRILDIGCGGGILAESMALRGADVLGIDMGAEVLAIAKLHQLESGAVLNYQRTTVEALAAEQSACFDVITCMEMLEHVPDPASIVQACARLIKPGGHVFFSTINRNVKAYLFAIIGAEYVLRLLPKGTHTFKKFIRPSELESWVRAAGLSLVHMTGMHYNPLLRQQGLVADVSVNYIAHTRREPT